MGWFTEYRNALANSIKFRAEHAQFSVQLRKTAEGYELLMVAKEDDATMELLPTETVGDQLERRRYNKIASVIALSMNLGTGPARAFTRYLANHANNKAPVGRIIEFKSDASAKLL